MWFIWTMSVLSLIFNLLLVILVRRVNVVAMGSYPILLYVSASMDVLIALSNAIIEPNIHMGKFSFVVFGMGTARWPALPGLISIYVFDLLFYQTFVLLCYQFIYRFVVLHKSRPTSPFAKLRIRNWIGMGIVLEIIFTSLMTFFVSHFEPRTDWKPDSQLKMDMLSYYGIDMNKPFGNFHVVYAEMNERDGSLIWNVPILIYTISILGLILTLGVIMLLCAKGVLSMIRSLSADCNLRATTHRQFFRALLLQTLVPLVISFAPVSCLVLLPLTGLQFGALGNYLMSITAVYPAIDPLLLIFCVQSYRRKIFSTIERYLPGKTERVSPASSFSLAVERISARCRGLKQQCAG